MDLRLVGIFIILGVSWIFISLIIHGLSKNKGWIKSVGFGFIVLMLSLCAFLKIWSYFHPSAAVFQNVNQSPKPNLGYSERSSSQENSVKQVMLPLEPEYNLPHEEVKLFARDIYSRIESGEQFLKDAVDSNDVKGMTEYSDRWRDFSFKPYREPPPNTTPHIGQKYWPYSEDASPYIACDEAINELSSLSNLYKNRILNDAAWVRGSVREHESNYHKAKNKCKQRINMTYEQASAAEDAK